MPTTKSKSTPDPKAIVEARTDQPPPKKKKDQTPAEEYLAKREEALLKGATDFREPETETENPWSASTAPRLTQPSSYDAKQAASTRPTEDRAYDDPEEEAEKKGDLDISDQVPNEVLPENDETVFVVPVPPGSDVMDVLGSEVDPHDAELESKAMVKALKSLSITSEPKEHPAKGSYAVVVQTEAWPWFSVRERGIAEFPGAPGDH